MNIQWNAGISEVDEILLNTALGCVPLNMQMLTQSRHSTKNTLKFDVQFLIKKLSTITKLVDT